MIDALLMLIGLALGGLIFAVAWHSADQDVSTGDSQEPPVG